MQEQANPLTLLSHAIVFVDSYEKAEAVVNNQGQVKEFFILGDNNKRPSAAINATFKKRNVRVFRIRPSGAWNALFRAMGEVEQARERNHAYGQAGDLMFISLLPAAEIASALKRHRAVNHLSCREMYFLDTLDLGEADDDGIALALKCMPNIPAPIHYNNLTIQQRFDLTSFEFPRFTRPIHCVDSVANMQDCVPFYTTKTFDKTFQSVGMTASGANGRLENAV